MSARHVVSTLGDLPFPLAQPPAGKAWLMIAARMLRVRAGLSTKEFEQRATENLSADSHT
jgi:hypothetical protein